jgi:hypothetical protein
MEKETYIGDGLYASFDGYQIKLRAPRDGGDHEVYLESSAFEELMKFAGEFWVYQEISPLRGEGKLPAE